MKTFKELNKAEVLDKMLSSEYGTLYYHLDVKGNIDKVIRFLDGELTPELLPAYVQLYEAVLQYIDVHPQIKKYVFMSQLIEVGVDYIIRPFYVYSESTSRYFDLDEPLEPYPEYYEMIRAFSEEMINKFSDEDITNPDKQSIIKRILRKSLIEPRGKTFFEGRDINKYVIIEPAISIKDIEKWQMINEE